MLLSFDFHFLHRGVYVCVFVDRHLEQKRTLTRASLFPLQCKLPINENNAGPRMQFESLHKLSDAEINEQPSLDQVNAEDQLVDNKYTDISLVNGVNDFEIEDSLMDRLDSLCSPLRNTPRLEDKALRVVFSVGVEAAIVDAEQSAKIGKLRLTPKDLLSDAMTEKVFGRFSVEDL